jgi:hypothetical protein
VIGGTHAEDKISVQKHEHHLEYLGREINQL